MIRADYCWRFVLHIDLPYIETLCEVHRALHPTLLVVIADILFNFCTVLDNIFTPTLGPFEEKFCSFSTFQTEIVQCVLL